MADDDATPTTPEQRIAENIKAIREDLKMKQGQLAERMTAMGYKWHQATVAKVETNERQVQLGEAHALAAVFGVPLQDIVGATSEAMNAAKLSALVTRVRSAKMELATAHRVWWGLRAELAGAIRAGDARDPDDDFQAPWDVEGELRDALDRLPVDQRQRVVELSGEDFEDLSDAGMYFARDATGTWWDDPNVKDPAFWGLARDAET
ncbi:helix-turn-helix domain-containing protein [Tsukamurella spumae]|uniref:Helix-turn-helix transcriptional regulator n=1 Tax=Tsukamurella spumae TaxID=44753 RepID=A0A846X913_9ACTN|nr:helix-turn-helix transcriptional regulator [Tsukamurella spumae]NKY20926.1 helix-turn-helix transcriptional regulator [Tsukamurella spumae]